MDFRVLGPIEVINDAGEALPLGGRRQRAVLAVLIRHVARVTSMGDLIDAVYGDEPPASAANALQVYVSSLRKLLGTDRVSYHPPGYILAAELEETDLGRFDQLAAEARVAQARGDHSQAADLLAKALQLVRGRPFADLDDLEFARRAAVAIQERIDEAVRQRVEAQLALGGHAELLTELGELVDEHPFDERLRQQLMLALYRSGSQSGALERYREGRAVLLDQLGVDPGPELVELHQAILRQDPKLELATPVVWRLPMPPAAPLGRGAELLALRSTLADPGVRLVTLTGVGGSGKTHLALAAAHALANQYEAGAVFVPLAPVATAELVPAAIAGALGIDAHGSGGRSDVRAVISSLTDRRLLVVLDNFEHLMAGSDMVKDLLATLPDLTLLITSRVPLRIRGEQLYPVPPLALPTDDSLAAVEAAASVQLFAARARAVLPTFEVTADNAATVAAICRRLDGLPLPLELAAGRVGLLDLPELLVRLERRLSTLVGGARDLPERQQTLRATLDWSHQLLSQGEQRLFARLSLLAGGGELLTVEALSGETDGLELTGQLIDAGLLLRDGEDRAGRLRMLETVREYAAERLSGSPDEGEAHRVVAQHLIALFSALHDEGSQLQLAALDDDFHTVRACLPWLLAHEPSLAAELVGSAEGYIRYRGFVRDGRGWTDAAAAVSGLDPTLRFQLLFGSGDLALDDSDFDAADKALGEALALARRLAEPDRIAQTLTTQAWAFLYRGMLPEAERAGLEAVGLADAAGKAVHQARALSVCGCAAAEQGNHMEAAAYLHQAINIAPPEAIGTLTECYSNLSLMYVLAGDAATGYKFGQIAMDMARREDNFRLLLSCIDQTAWAALLVGRESEAAALWRETLLLRRGAHDDDGYDFALWGLSAVAAARDQHTASVRLAAAAKRREVAPSAAVEQLVTAHVDRVRAALGEDHFDRSWRLGRSMDLDAVLALALTLK